MVFYANPPKHLWQQRIVDAAHLFLPYLLWLVRTLHVSTKTVKLILFHERLAHREPDRSHTVSCVNVSAVGFAGRETEEPLYVSFIVAGTNVTRVRCQRDPINAANSLDSFVFVFRKYFLWCLRNISFGNSHHVTIYKFLFCSSTWSIAAFQVGFSREKSK